MVPESPMHWWRVAPVEGCVHTSRESFRGPCTNLTLFWGGGGLGEEGKAGLLLLTCFRSKWQGT